MSTQANPLLTPEEYLRIEREAEYKSEYYQGEMFAWWAPACDMPGLP
jgi:hypothetical protein